ncbi:MAG: twin-arginine translocase TatA/TatE family subunit [Pelobium sp.]
MYNGVLLFLNLGTQEVVLIMFAVLLLFGGEKLPELARGLGKGIREFKDASDGVKREIHRNINQLTADEELKREEEIEHISEVSNTAAVSVAGEEVKEAIEHINEVSNTEVVSVVEEELKEEKFNNKNQ